MKSKASVNVYLILVQGDKVLLSLRENTGYEDGKWALVAGHQEEGESATQALIREAQEEIGITIDPADLTIVHVMHRKTERENVDIFMECSKWQGTIINNEPHKCGGLQFYSFDAFPEHSIAYVMQAIAMSRSAVSYSELGWVSLTANAHQAWSEHTV